MRFLRVATGTLAAAACAVVLVRAQVGEVRTVAPDVYFHEGDIKGKGHCNNGWVVPLAAAFYGGIGAGIGVGGDAMVDGQQVIYASAQPLAARLTIAPLLTARRQGVLMSWRFAKR